MGAREFVDKAYVALKEDGMDVRHMDDLALISGIMYQAFLGSAADAQKSYILQNQRSYQNALNDALNEFDRLEIVKSRKSLQSGLNDLFQLLKPPSY
jgi:hypothetical protein